MSPHSWSLSMENTNLGLSSGHKPKHNLHSSHCSWRVQEQLPAWAPVPATGTETIQFGANGIKHHCFSPCPSAKSRLNNPPWAAGLAQPPARILKVTRPFA